MSRKWLTKPEVEQALKQLKQSKAKPTLRNIRSLTGFGNLGTISKFRESILNPSPSQQSDI